MKELKLFENWAVEVSNSYITEAKKSDRPLNHSIQTIAQRNYPDLSPEDALIAYMGDKLTDMESKDIEQTKLINRQSQETNKLMNTVQGIRAAYDELERDSQSVEQELEQIRGGHERTKSGNEQNIVSAKEIMKIEAELEELRQKPGMTPEKFKDLEEKLNNSKGDKELFDKMANNIEDLLRKNEITRSSYDELMKEYEILEKDRNDREKRFADSLKGNSSKFKEYEGKIKNLETEIANTLKKFPDENQIEKLKDMPKKVKNIEDRIEKNDKVDDVQNIKISKAMKNARSAQSFATHGIEYLEREIGNLKNGTSTDNSDLKPSDSEFIDHARAADDAWIQGIEQRKTKDVELRKRDADLKAAAHARRQARKNSSAPLLPKSYTNAIDTLAEHILGDQYGKYLK